jgi:hypothetical protein
MSPARFKQRIYLQEDGCVYTYCVGRFTCISISSLVVESVFDEVSKNVENIRKN